MNVLGIWWWFQGHRLKYLDLHADLKDELPAGVTAVY